MFRARREFRLLRFVFVHLSAAVHRAERGVPHRLCDAGGRHRQQRHRAGGLHQPAAPVGDGAAGGHCGGWCHPSAAHSHDVPDHHSGPCGHGLRRRRRYGSDAAGGAGVHRWPAVRHSHDAAGGAVYVRHPQPPGAAEGGGDGPADAGYLMGRGTFPEEFSLIELPFKLIVATAWVPILM